MARSRSTRGPWLVAGAGAALLLIGGAGVGTWGMMSHGFMSNSVTQLQTYRQPVETLAFNGGSSDVMIVGGAPAGTVEVTRRLRWGPGGSQPEPQESWSGTTLAISPDCGGSFMSMCSIDYDIKVPDATAVNVDIGSGDITLGGRLATVSASSGSGGIEAKSLATPTLLARTGSGDLDLDLAAAPTTATVKTGSGDLNLQVPRGDAYVVTGTTGSGDREITVDQAAGSTHKITAETGSGDVTVAYR